MYWGSSASIIICKEHGFFLRAAPILQLVKVLSQRAAIRKTQFGEGRPVVWLYVECVRDNPVLAVPPIHSQGEVDRDLHAWIVAQLLLLHQYCLHVVIVEIHAF